MIKKRFTKAKELWREYKTRKSAVFGLAILIAIVFLGCFASILSPYEPLRTRVGPAFTPPNLEHPMGTDDVGRDVFAIVLHGIRTSALIGVTAALMTAILGSSIGLLSGFLGGKIDDVLMRVLEIFQIFENSMFFILLVLVAVFGSSILNIILVIGGVCWPTTARLLRAEVLSIKESEYVQASRAIGMSNLGIAFYEILPNALNPVIVTTSLRVARAILTEAGLSFLGLGDPNVASWGMLIYVAQRYLRSAWWLAFFPGLFIFLTVLSLNLITDGLNDCLNPRRRQLYV